MPPKKKKSAKKGGKKSAKKEPEPPPKIEELTEASKEYYRVQLQDLEKRLERYQKRCDELEVIGGNIKDKFEQMTAEKKDVVGYLKKTLDDKTNELTDLNDRVVGLQQARDSEKDQYDQQLQSLKTDFQEMKDKLTSDNMILSGKLASLEEFRVQKEKLMSDMDNLEKTIKHMEEDRKEVIYQLERKQVVDKDRLKKEMVMRVNQVAAEFRKVSNKQMAETTKRTIRENVAINAQLSKMSDKTVELIQENDELKQKERKQKMQIDLFETTEKELARKNRSQLKVIQMLTDKCKQLEAELDEMEARKEDKIADGDGQDNVKTKLLEEFRDENDRLLKTNEELAAEVENLKSRLADTERAKDRMGGVIAEAASAIQELIKTPTDKDEDVPQTPLDPVIVQNIAFENLLALLNSACALGMGPNMEDLAYKSKQRKQLPASARAIHRGELPLMKPMIDSMVFYHPGDLGMVPRVDQHIPTKLDRMRKPLISEIDEGYLPQPRPEMVSIGVQTASTPKAIFFADKLLDHMTAKDKLLDVMHNDLVLPSIGKRPQPTALSTLSTKVY